MDDDADDFPQEPCWQHPAADGDPCANCGRPWPECISDRGLVFAFWFGDCLPVEDVTLLEAEIAKRGLSTDTPP